jgi:RNA polymerase sigma factor (sigma-70 family)
LLEKKEQSATLFRAIDRLPEQQKSAFILHKLEDLSYAEVAAVLEVSVASVESLLFRAKQNLRKLLRDYYVQNFPA